MVNLPRGEMGCFLPRSERASFLPATEGENPWIPGPGDDRLHSEKPNWVPIWQDNKHLFISVAERLKKSL
jgi:hypothetical protein